ncbi:MAG: hypothetical protein HY741_19430 [Chloroflexi bacterium]|nr:hypothetical protein [Chloroflexota bacterium]
MATATQKIATTQSPLARVVIGSLIASLVLGMWTMMVEGILHIGENFVAGLFSPVEYIAATVLGGLGNPNFYPAGQLPPVDALAIILGLMGHMMNAVIFGLVFYAIATRLPNDRRSLIIAGVVYGVAIFIGMWFIALPILDPVMLRVNLIAFLLGHMMFGAALGLTTVWARGIQG